MIMKMEKIRFSNIQINEKTKQTLKFLIRKNTFLFPYYLFCLLIFIYWLVWILRYV